jgi:hypothetical protein
MTKIKSNYLDSLPEWHWVLAFKKEEFLNEYLDKKIGVNKNYSRNQRWKFIDGIYKSLSLNKSEKENVLRHYKGLSAFQLEQLMVVFAEEREKFLILEQEFPQDIDKLTYKTLLEWAILIDDTYGDYVFIEKFLTDKFRDGDYSKHIIPLIELMDEYNKYESILVLAEKVLFESTKIEHLCHIYNAYLYGIAFTKKFYQKGDYSYKKISDKIDYSELSNKNKYFLKFCYWNYMAKSHGFKVISNKIFIIHIRNYRKSGSKNLISSLGLYYFSNGKMFNYLKCCFKSTKLNLKGKKINSANILERYNGLRDLDSRKEIIININQLIVAMFLANKKRFESHIYEISQCLYNILLNESNVVHFFDISKNIALLEIILKRTVLSSSNHFKLLLEEEDKKNIDVKYLFNINNGFNSFDDILNKAKEIISKYNKYIDICFYLSILVIFLVNYSKDKNINLFILKEIENICYEKGIFNNEEFSIYRNTINGFSDDSFNQSYERLMYIYLDETSD